MIVESGLDLVKVREGIQTTSSQRDAVDRSKVREAIKLIFKCQLPGTEEEKLVKGMERLRSIQSREESALSPKSAMRLLSKIQKQAEVLLKSLDEDECDMTGIMGLLVPSGEYGLRDGMSRNEIYSLVGHLQSLVRTVHAVDMQVTRGQRVARLKKPYALMPAKSRAQLQCAYFVVGNFDRAGRRVPDKRDSDAQCAAEAFWLAAGGQPIGRSKDEAGGGWENWLRIARESWLDAQKMQTNHVPHFSREHHWSMQMAPYLASRQPTK